MPFSAKILADSVSPAEVRLTTFEVTFPRFVLAEFNTHRVFSRNSASSRAIPVVKQLRRILDEPYVPIEFGSNQPGMQAGPPLEGEARIKAEKEWLEARDDAVRHVLGLIATPEIAGSDDLDASLETVAAKVKAKEIPEDWLNVHKQVANRLLEPFMWHTVIVTSCEWSNFWNLRTHGDAQPEIRVAAKQMLACFEQSEPEPKEEDEWHLPLVRPEDRAAGLSDADLVKISAGRCARVSYLTHDGRRDPAADIELHDRLLESGHMSPLEHPAKALGPADRDVFHGNIRGWISYRSQIDGESDPLGSQARERVTG